VNPAVFLIALAICVSLDSSFLGLVSMGGVHPSATATLMVFVALFAPRSIALWAAFGTGLLVDLLSPGADSAGRPLHLPGPHALGYVFGTQLVLLLRSMVFRRNPIALGILTLPYLVAVGLPFMALWSVRGLLHDAPVPWQGEPATRELMRWLGRGIYSAAFGIPFGWLLLTTWPIWRFDTSSIRR